MPDTWKYYAIDAIEQFLSENSDRYNKSLLDVIKDRDPKLVEKYFLIWEEYQYSSDSETYNKLVKRLIELSRYQAGESNKKDIQVNQALKNIKN